MYRLDVKKKGGTNIRRRWRQERAKAGKKK